GAGPATGRRTLSRTRPLTTGTRPRRRGTRRGTGADAERVVADPRRPRPRLRARLGALGARRDDARRGSRTRLRSRLDVAGLGHRRLGLLRLGSGLLGGAAGLGRHRLGRRIGRGRPRLGLSRRRLGGRALLVVLLLVG